MDIANGAPTVTTLTQWERVATLPDYIELRRRQRIFVFPMAALFLAWFLIFVSLAAYAGELMSVKVFGNVNIGLLMGLLQFVSTFAITGLYVVFAGRRLDPLADRIREEVQRGGV